jgi:hypothetical protein
MQTVCSNAAKKNLELKSVKVEVKGTVAWDSVFDHTIISSKQNKGFKKF